MKKEEDKTTQRTNNNKNKQARKQREKQKQKQKKKQRQHINKINKTQKETIYRHAQKNNNT